MIIVSAKSRLGMSVIPAAATGQHNRQFESASLTVPEANAVVGQDHAHAAASDRNISSERTITGG